LSQKNKTEKRHFLFVPGFTLGCQCCACVVYVATRRCTKNIRQPVVWSFNKTPILFPKPQQWLHTEWVPLILTL